jgi:hypothetical protein
MHRKAVVAADRSKKSTKSLSFRQAPFPEASRGNKGEAIRKPWIAPAPASARAASAGRGTAPGGPPFRGFPHTPSVEDVVPVRPIFTMNKDDAEGLEQEANLAAMPWEDFEHLVRQLFRNVFFCGLPSSLPTSDCCAMWPTPSNTTGRTDRARRFWFQPMSSRLAAAGVRCAGAKESLVAPSRSSSRRKTTINGRCRRSSRMSSMLG